MVKKGPNVPPAAAAGLICLVLGAAAGFFARDSQFQSASASTGGGSAGGGSAAGSGGMLPPPPNAVPLPGQSLPARVGAGGPGGPGGPGGGGGFGGAAAPNPGRDLARLVSSLNTVEKIQNKGLTAEQKKQLLPLLQEIQKADTLPEAEATVKLEAVKKTLTADQQQALTDLTPQRGGRGGGGGGMGGPPGGGAPGSGGGAAQPDPNKPFASERNKKALEDLLANLK